MADRKRVVIFDIDGTLIDSVDSHAKAWQQVFAAHGYDFGFDEIRSQIGKGGDQLMPVFLPEDVIKSSGKAFEQERKELFQREYLPQLRPFAQVRDLILRLKAEGIGAVLASSAKKDDLEPYLKIAEIEDLIDDATTSDDAERSKPHPDIFHAALSKLDGVDPAETLVVGDTPYDAEAAGKAGIATIGVLCGGFPEDDLRKAGCVAIYRDPADLLARLEGSPIMGGRK